MPDILTITLNPALDLATSTATVTPGVKLRCAAPQVDPGGGGLNVSRAIRNLGGETSAFVAVGGGVGARVLDLLVAENINVIAHDAPGETRQSIAVTDRTRAEQYRFMLPGPDWTAADADRAMAAIAAHAGYRFAVLSGSLPPGVPADFPLRLAAALPADAQLVVDTSGPALVHLAKHPGGVAVLRMNGAEAEEIAGRALPQVADSLDFAAALVARGVARVVIVARGAEGSVLAAGGTRLHSRTPPVKVISRIGAGDSFVGALTLSLSRGDPLAQALKHATAAASAAVMTEATRLCTADDVARLLGDCVVTAA